MTILQIAAVVWLVAIAFGALLYGLDWLAGAVHRYRSKRRSLWR